MKIWNGIAYLTLLGYLQRGRAADVNPQRLLQLISGLVYVSSEFLVVIFA